MIKNIAILLLLAAFAAPAAGQKVRTPEVREVKVWKTGDSLSVKLQIAINKRLNGRNYKQSFTPVLYTDSISRELPKVTVQTRRTRILDAREEISYGKGAQAEEPYYEAGHDTLIDYLHTTLYREWMEHAALRLDRWLSGCCSDSLLSPVGLSADLRLQQDTGPQKPELPQPVLAEQAIRMIDQHIPVNPSVKPVTREWEFTREDMIIDFRVSLTEIDFTLFENRKTLEEIVNAVRQIKNLPGAKLNKIEITGYASPEGKMTFNKQIAGERANALKEHILQQLPGLEGSEFTLINGGENWKGLRKMVAASSMAHKAEILYIIDHVPTEIDYARNTSRKKQLMDLANGVPYNYMRKAFFDKLRNACYISIYYDTANDSAADVINMAIQLIRDKEFEKALEKLLAVKEDPRAWNCIGVCYLLEGKPEEAEPYLQKAADNGNELAKKNLLLIQK